MSNDIFEKECLRTYLGIVEADCTIPPRFYLFDLFGLYLEFGIDWKSFTIKRLTPVHQKTSRTLLKEHFVAVKWVDWKICCIDTSFIYYKYFSFRVIIHSVQTKNPVFESEIVTLPLRDNLKVSWFKFDFFYHSINLMIIFLLRPKRFCCVGPRPTSKQTRWLHTFELGLVVGRDRPVAASVNKIRNKKKLTKN